MRKGTFYVIGDVMLDAEYYLSPRDHTEQTCLCGTTRFARYYPGGAANVATILHLLGAERVVLFGAVGKSSCPYALMLRSCLEPISVRLSPEFPTTTLKQRFALDHSRYRFDLEDTHPTSQPLDWAAESVSADDPDCIVFSDYNKGVFGLHVQPQVQSLIGYGVPTVVDPTEPSYQCIWDNAFLSTANHLQAQRLSLNVVCRATTKAEQGVTLETDSNAQHFNVPMTIPHPQVVGAGDAFTAASALALSRNLSAEEAVRFAVKVASGYVSFTRRQVYAQLYDWVYNHAF